MAGPMMGISVRPARASDADDVAELTVQLGYDVEGSALAARLSRILAQADQRFLIAELEGGRSVGCMRLSGSSSRRTPSW